MSILKPNNTPVDIINKSTLILKAKKEEEHGSVNEEMLETEEPDDYIYRVMGDQPNSKERRLSNTVIK